MTSEEIIRLASRAGFSAKSTDRDEGGDDNGGGAGTVIERRTKTQAKTKRPSMFKVILLNDDYTPMEFVVDLLKSVFHKPHAEATKIMLWVHQNGMGVAGVYPFEIAETKVHAVEELAREAQYPLKCVMEKE
jgi:ATP-dependent Clp protease adaptor protein ClpS